MTLRINNNTSAINAHRQLLKNDNGLSKTLEKLSSGLKINRASEGPAALVISEQMRGQIAGMKQAIDNSETAVSMIQTTEANLQEVSGLLTSIRQLAVHAANEGANDQTMLEADQQEIANSLQTIDRIALQAQFGNAKLLDGSRGASGKTTGAGLEFVKATIDTKDSSKEGFEIQVNSKATKANVTSTAALSAEMIQGGETLTLIENGRMASYTTKSDDTVDMVIKNMETEIQRNGLDLDISANENGTLDVSHKMFGSGHEFQVSSSSEGVLSQAAGEIEVSNDGTDIKGTINGESTTGKGQVLSGISGAHSIDGLEIKYSGDAEIPEDGLVVGRSYVSQNTKQYQVGANYGQKVGLSIESVHSKTLGNNIENGSGYESIADIDVRTAEGANDALLMIDQAITKMASRRGELGAFQKNTLETNLNNLRVATENLISCESVIRDVDMAAEMATYTKQQIMSQSATAMLAQANQTPKMVLSLLQ